MAPGNQQLALAISSWLLAIGKLFTAKGAKDAKIFQFNFSAFSAHPAVEISMALSEARPQ